MTRSIFLAIVLFFVPAPAVAQDLAFGEKDPDVPSGVEWKASAQAGVIVTTGNSETTTISAGANVSRKEGDNKLAVEAKAGYARSSIFIAQDADASGFIEADEIQEVTTTTTQSWLFKGRYDRFFGDEKNSVFATGFVSVDEPAGKELLAGGQLGYSRSLYKTEAHSLVGETGYALAYEKFTTADDSVVIHSLLATLAYAGKLSADTSLETSIDSLFNVNTLDTPTGEVGAFEDTRIVYKLALTTRLWEKVSFRFGFQAKYDAAPAPRPPFATPYASGFVPVADELDTATEATLIVSLL